jgi:hypothetical protein
MHHPASRDAALAASDSIEAFVRLGRRELVPSTRCERGIAHSEHQPRQRVGFVKGGLHSIQTGNRNCQNHRNGDTLVFDFCAIAKILNPTFC